MAKVKVLIVGAGSRGYTYAQFAALKPEKMEVVGVAEPRKKYRDMLVQQFNIDKDHIFDHWLEAAEVSKFADAVIIATQDKDHTEPAIAFANKKYNILLEKPMAVTPEECEAIYEAVKSNKILFGVCHVLRYTPFTKQLKSIIDSGAIGDIVSIQRLEPIGFWHFAHSYTRGNWRNENESSFMLLAKSCHDIDWIHYIMGKKCTAVSSFGSLLHFRKENKPKNAGNRCVNCNIEKDCPYSAKKIYIDFNENINKKEWPADVLTPDCSKEGILKAITDGPYGRCVYLCDNDVMDNQVVNMQFENGSTASFVVTAFTETGGGRRTTIFGTKGEIRGNDDKITVYDFLTRKETEYSSQAGGHDASSGHGGGDFGLMEDFINAVSTNNPDLILSGLEETLDSHLLTFYAEQSRLEEKVIHLTQKTEKREKRGRCERRRNCSKVQYL